MARSEDLIGIFSNENYEQLFINASLMKVTVTESSQIMTHPVEDGSRVSDHQIFDLIKISIPIVLSSDDFISVFQSIQKGYKSSTLYTIQTKVSVYKNMMIDSLPHEETVESGIRLMLTLTEFNEQVTSVGTAPNVAPKSAKDSNTIKRGVQNGKTVENEEKKTSIIKGIYS